MINQDKKEKAISLAKAVAYEHRTENSYLPQSEDEVNDFVPHEWVVDAILRAENTGFLQLDDCYNPAQVETKGDSK